ncbi:hypothetical protein [Gemmatimonas sp.]|uniref:hypothetical protein n=1 Tax=Gemmatimonas sp. TaxID=1962908 RepID=UPI003562C269
MSRLQLTGALAARDRRALVYSVRIAGVSPHAKGAKPFTMLASNTEVESLYGIDAHGRRGRPLWGRSTLSQTVQAVAPIGTFPDGCVRPRFVSSLTRTPGVSVLACVRRADDGHRHAYDGEFTTLVVQPLMPADSVFASPPPSAHTIRMIDFAYLGPEQLTRGAQLLRVENSGQQDHQVRLARMRAGASLRSWMTADHRDAVAKTFAGMARVGPGEVAYLPVDLAPGAYVAYCLIAEATTRRPHLELGMVRLIQVP